MFCSHKSSVSCSNCIAWGVLAGTAIGCAYALMSKQKQMKAPCMKKKAINALDTAGNVMHNIADFVK